MSWIKTAGNQKSCQPTRGGGINRSREKHWKANIRNLAVVICICAVRWWVSPSHLVLLVSEGCYRVRSEQGGLTLTFFFPSSQQRWLHSEENILHLDQTNTAEPWACVLVTVLFNTEFRSLGTITFLHVGLQSSEHRLMRRHTAMGRGQPLKLPISFLSQRQRPPGVTCPPAQSFPEGSWGKCRNTWNPPHSLQVWLEFFFR